MYSGHLFAEMFRAWGCPGTARLGSRARLSVSSAFQASLSYRLRLVYHHRMAKCLKDIAYA